MGRYVEAVPFTPECYGDRATQSESAPDLALLRRTVDAEPGQLAVIVSESFVEQVLGGRNPVGRRVRYLDAEADALPEPWHEIVGVVRDLGTRRGPGEAGAAIYHAAAPDPWTLSGTTTSGPSALPFG